MATTRQVQALTQQWKRPRKRVVVRLAGILLGLRVYYDQNYAPGHTGLPIVGIFSFSASSMVFVCDMDTH